MKTEGMNSKGQQKQSKKDEIYLGDLAKIDPNREPRYLEEVRRNKNGEIIAYVLKRNPNYILSDSIK
jgi:hypothetical protein